MLVCYAPGTTAEGEALPAPAHPRRPRWELPSHLSHTAGQGAGLQGGGLAPHPRPRRRVREWAGHARQRPEASFLAPLTPGSGRSGFSVCSVCLGGVRSEAKCLLFQCEGVQFRKEPLDHFNQCSLRKRPPHCARLLGVCVDSAGKYAAE